MPLYSQVVSGKPAIDETMVARARARDETTVVAIDETTVVASDETTVVASDETTVVASDETTVVAIEYVNSICFEGTDDGTTFLNKIRTNQTLAKHIRHLESVGTEETCSTLNTFNEHVFSVMCRNY